MRQIHVGLSDTIGSRKGDAMFVHTVVRATTVVKREVREGKQIYTYVNAN